MQKLKELIIKLLTKEQNIFSQNPSFVVDVSASLIAVMDILLLLVYAKVTKRFVVGTLYRKWRHPL